MRDRDSTRFRFAVKSVLTTAALVVCLTPTAFADKRSEARDQFERAVKMRTMLEGLLPRDRSLDDYKQTIAAYQKVYLVSTQAEEVTPSLIAEAELYEEMGRLYDPKFFQTAINMYQFLLKQYPDSRYRGEAMFAIAAIQKADQKNLDAAEAKFKDFLRRYPKNARAADARDALAEITAARQNPQPAGERGANAPARASESTVAAPMRRQDLAQLGPLLEPRESSKAWTSVKSIEATNTADHTRLIVTLDDTVTFDEAHLYAPDRIYFDLNKTRVGPKIQGKSLDFENGLLKSVRVGQNQPNVVRIVLDANGAKDCTASLVGKPYRLVIDLRAEGTTPSNLASNATSDAAPIPPAPLAPASSRERATPAETIAVATNRPAVQPDAACASNVGPCRPEADSAVAKLGKPALRAKLASSKPAAGAAAALKPPPEAMPTHDGQRSLTRTLGLKIGRIVIDAGHGGHDTGTIGPRGLMEKDLCLDVALRLGHIIEEKLPGAEVVYTRKDDTFIPLEQRTALANEAKADLFVSIHANSSRDHDARGVETYYLNFASSSEAMEVATRENAYSERSLHDLQDLIQKIARNEKIEESKELATDIQDSLSHRLQLISSNERNRGVKRAPFIVLIGANMPSVLAEISFVSNPTDERLLKRPEQRERIANGLYRGIAAYLESLNSLSYNKQKLASDAHPASDAPAPPAGSGPGPGSRPDQ